MPDTDDPYGDWRQHLTPELRRKFERKGREIVEAEVFQYTLPSKRQAAQVWLAEKRRRQSRTEWIRFGVIVAIGLASLVATLYRVLIEIPR